MRATEVLQKCLGDALKTMHANRQRTLLHAVESLTQGRRLTLMDLARSWPGAERIRAPLKALDRLLSNRHLHAEREQIYRRIVHWLVRRTQPVIIVDWSDLKEDRSWHLLRAAVPVGGRTLPILDMVFPGGMQGSPKAEAIFLKRLALVLPHGARPILVTDAGFRAPWFRAVEALGWQWLGRLRHRTHVKPEAAPNQLCQWVSCKAMYELAIDKPRDFGLMDMVRGAPLTARVVLHAKPPKGRKHRTRQHQLARNSQSRKNALRESEPWLLVASPSLSITARQLVHIYERRMQIELSFRDLKSHRYGQGFEDSLTRKGERIEVLLLLSALATFASWLVGMACEASGLDAWLTPFRSNRRLYSIMRLGREALVRGWRCPRLSELIDQLVKPTPQLLDQLGIPV